MTAEIPHNMGGLFGIVVVGHDNLEVVARLIEDGLNCTPHQ